jgi:hypothetical protein
LKVRWGQGLGRQEKLGYARSQVARRHLSLWKGVSRANDV